MNQEQFEATMPSKSKAEPLSRVTEAKANTCAWKRLSKPGMKAVGCQRSRLSEVGVGSRLKHRSRSGSYVDSNC